VGRERRPGHEGQALVIVVLGMVAFMGFLGLALDGGSAYLQQRGLQRAADMAALAAASSYFRTNYAGTNTTDCSQSNGNGNGNGNGNFNNGNCTNTPPPIATGVSAARSAATTVVVKDGYVASVLATPVLLDYLGADLAAQCNPSPCPQQTDVRGVRVSLSRSVPTSFMRVAGITQTTTVATAKVMITNPGGAVREAPLLLQNYVDSTYNLARNNPYGSGQQTCSTNTGGDGYRYPVGPDDCRVTVGTPVVFVPAAETSIPALSGVYSGAQLARYYVLHDAPTCNTGGTGPAFSSCDATATSVSNGLGVTVLTCPPSSSASSCATPQYWAELSHFSGGSMADDKVATGMNSRIDRAFAGAWSQQDCGRPGGGGGTKPLTADNPRLVRLPVHYGSALSGSSNQASARVSETVMLCVQYTGIGTHLPQSGSNYAVTGYLVNTPDLSATTVGTLGQYSGQDVLIRLFS
jgi:hypothetical protein